MTARFAAAALCLAACGTDVAAPPTAPMAPARLRMLTDAQYTNAVRDLLGIEVPLATPGAVPFRFIHEEMFAVDAPRFVHYRVAAETAGRVVATRPDLIGCPDLDAACVRARVDELAARAFRRPLDAGERDELWSIYEAAAPDGPAAGFGLVVETVLQAPSFLYRTELGAASAESVELTPYEMAAQLGFLFLDSIPDEPLWQAARDGSIADPQTIAAHVERLLELPRVRDHITGVVLAWLEVYDVFAVHKDPHRYPELDYDLRASMYTETAKFTNAVLWKRGGSLRTLLTSSETFVDPKLAALYEIDPKSDDFAPVTLDGRLRAGVLTHGSILTNLATSHSESIIHRGIFVHRKLLCTTEPGRPPFLAIAKEAAFVSQLSESQAAHYRAAHVYCSSCHRTIDPPGRALHHYDGIGRYRTRDALDMDIDASDTIMLDGRPRTFANAIELSRLLAESPQVGECVVDQLAHHALGRAVLDPATREHLRVRFEQSDRDLVEVFRAIATAPGFHRRGWAP